LPVRDLGDLGAKSVEIIVEPPLQLACERLRVVGQAEGVLVHEQFVAAACKEAA
jgi:hypothetical protein